MNYREAWANGEIEAGTLVDRIEEQAQEIERFKAARSEKGSRKALGAMNAKLRAKIGRLERELAALSANHSEQVRVLPVELLKNWVTGLQCGIISQRRVLEDIRELLEVKP